VVGPKHHQTLAERKHSNPTGRDAEAHSLTVSLRTDSPPTRALDVEGRPDKSSLYVFQLKTLEMYPEAKCSGRSAVC
jgi:hypothetical protein